jgi:hypothetical protein
MDTSLSVQHIKITGKRIYREIAHAMASLNNNKERWLFPSQ